MARRTVATVPCRKCQSRTSLFAGLCLLCCIFALSLIASPEATIPAPALLQPCNNLRLSQLPTYEAFLHSTCLLDFRNQAAPSLSIVMTVHNSVDDTYRALCSLSQQTSPVPFEVVIVDDASTDATPVLMQRILGARTKRFEEKQRYALANNFAVFNLSTPSSSFIWFLNNDLEMGSPHVLGHLFAMLLQSPYVGAVGGKLVLLSGKLQEAGSFIWGDGHTVGYGREGDPNDPAFNYVREVDYCSAACLLLRRSLFASLNGFEAGVFPMYFEDTDLQMRIRYVANLSVIYQPLALIKHREHGSSSRRQVKDLINKARVLFTARWASQLLAHHFPLSPDNVVCAKNRRPGLRLLYIDLLYPDQSFGADFARTRAILSAISDNGHIVTIFSYANKRRTAAVTEFEQMGIEFCCFDSSTTSSSASSDLSSPALSAALTTFLRERQRQFDAIIISHANVFEHALPVLQQEARGVHVVFNAESFWWKWFYKKVELEAEQDALRWAEAEQRRRRGLFLHCQQAWLLTTSDINLVRTLPSPPRLWLMQHGIPPTHSNTTYAQRTLVGFAGVFRNPQDSDAEAMIWFLDNVWRSLAAALGSSAELHVAGVGAPRELAVVAEQRRVKVLNRAADAAFYSAVRVFVLPHQYGANMHNKMVEALSMGVPCVLMRQWAAPLGLSERTSGVLLADDAKSMAAAITQIWQSEELWRELAAAAVDRRQPWTNPTPLQNAIAESLAHIPRRVCTR